MIRNDSLMFEDLVLCDLFASTNEITFKIDKESIIRIVAHEPRGIDVDIRLLNENRNLIIESLSPKG